MSKNETRRSLKKLVNRKQSVNPWGFVPKIMKYGMYETRIHSTSFAEYTTLRATATQTQRVEPKFALENSSLTKFP